MTAPRPLRRTRIALIVVGTLVLLIAAAVLVTEVPPHRYLGIGAWLLGALIVHDGIIAAIVLAVGVLLRRSTPALPYLVTLIVQSTLAIGGIVTLLVLPEIVKQRIGSANPSLLPSDYLGALLGLWAALIILAAAATATVLLRRRQRRTL